MYTMQLKDFYSCIHSLLHDYDCVIIPGFGGLVAQPQAAQVNTISRQIYPRSKKIAFNQNLLSNDGLLAEYISRKEKCSYTEAVLLIQSMVRQIQQELADKNVVELEGTGTLRYDGENKLIFSASRNETFLYDSFGLKPVKAIPVTAVASDKPRIMDKQEEPVPVTADAEAEPTAEAPAEKAIRRKYRKLSIPFMAASVLVIAFAGLTMYLASQNATLPFLHPDGSQTASFVDTSTDVSNIPGQAATSEDTETTGTAETSTPAAETTEAPAVSSEPENNTDNHTPAAEATESSAGSGYYIIAGAFQVEGNAEKLLQELRTSGYANAQLAGRNESGNLLRVAYLKAPDMQEAENKLAEIRQNSKEGWILHIH